VDEIVSLVLALRQILFFEWVTLNEHKWVNSRERRGVLGSMQLQRRCRGRL
jgi:hypothetical protein